MRPAWLRRFQILSCTALLAVLAACDSGTPASDSMTATPPAATQAQPAAPELRSVTLMAPAAPGGGWDQTARALQQVMQDEKLVANAQVVNVPGAGGTIGLAQLVNSQTGNPDYLMVTGLIMLGAILTNDSAVTLVQVTPLARLIGEYEVLVVPADSPYQDLTGFLEAWKQNPGGMAIAGGSAGGTDHMLVGLLARELGIDTALVNYLPHSGGGESLASLLGSHVAAGMNGYAELKPFIDAGRLRALAFSSEERVAGVDIPTFIEQGVNVHLANWRSVAAPPGISSSQRDELVALVDSVRQSPAWADLMARNNWIDMYLSGTAYETFLAEETTRVAEVLRSIGLIQTAQ